MKADWVGLVVAWFVGKTLEIAGVGTVAAEVVEDGFASFTKNDEVSGSAAAGEFGVPDIVMLSPMLWYV